jgi:hypothetical protein
LRNWGYCKGVRGMGDSRDRLIIATLIGVFVLLAYGIFRHQGRQVEPGSTEYADYIEERIAVCIKKRLAADLERDRRPLPFLPTPSEREGTCRFVVHEFDMLHPEARPYRY